LGRRGKLLKGKGQAPNKSMEDYKEKTVKGKVPVSENTFPREKGRVLVLLFVSFLFVSGKNGLEKRRNLMGLKRKAVKSTTAV